MSKLFILVFIIILNCSSSLFCQSSSLKNLYQLSDSESRSISPENFTGEKGKGGMATLEEGTAANAARNLGQGWKVNPYIYIEPGATFTLGKINESGVINHIWMTPVGDYRLMILKIYWDDESEPSIEVPIGDFFAAGWGINNEPKINSIPIAVNPKSGFNSYWQMPFRKKCKITMENRGAERARIFYQIDYSLEEVEKDTPYFHAQFRRVNRIPKNDVYTIVDNIKGTGQYVGTYLAHGARSKGWWGEGEIKFYMDGDTDFPTICGTGEEDYFCGSYSYSKGRVYGKRTYIDYSGLYSGFHKIRDSDIVGFEGAYGQYRWHITDPIRFEENLKITIQCLGWGKDHEYATLEDDLASVAYWYQIEPHNPFPDLPSNENLMIEMDE